MRPPSVDYYLERFNNNLATRLACFDERMRLANILGIDRAEYGIKRRSDTACIDFCGDIAQQLVLFDHVGCLMHCTGEHEFPMQTGGFDLHAVHGHRQVGGIDSDDATLRSNQLDSSFPVTHVIEDGDVIHVIEAQRANLFHHRFTVIDDMVRTQFLDPVTGFRARCRGNDDQSGRLGELDADGADTATGADDQD